MHLYNEIDRFPAQWLRNLADAGHIDGPVTVDERSIADLTAADAADATQVHLFAGIGGWSHALKLAGWPATRPVWTGSCPCQPFSIAGKGAGTDDARHLWPEMRRLIGECLPPVVFGEQVASRAGREWLAGVRADLEAMGYAVGAADMCAAGAGTPHIRQRLYWGAVRLADAERGAAERHGHEVAGATESVQGQAREQRLRPHPGDGRDTIRLADTDGEIQSGRRVRRSGESDSASERPPRERSAGLRTDGRLADTDDTIPQGRQLLPKRGEQRAAGPCGVDGWAAADWLECLDGKARRIPAEPELFPLADGVPGRMGQLRAYGNAIVPQVAAQFITSFMEATHCPTGN